MIDIKEITITDPVYKEKLKYNFLEKFIISLLNDKETSLLSSSAG